MAEILGFAQPKRRKLTNWIDSFLEYTKVLPSPEIFRRWTAISLLSSVMERKAWAQTRGSKLFPNMYAVLIGPPGVGKSSVISIAEKMLRDTPGIKVAPASVTTASLVDSLADAKHISLPHGVLLQFNSLQVIASEFSVFLPSYESTYVNLLTKLYDGELYEERRRTGKVNHIKIDAPLLSILGGATPSYINSNLPESAWDQGFISRTVMIFAGDAIKSPIFGIGGNALESIYNDLMSDLRMVSEIIGEFDFLIEAQEEIVKWDDKDLEPIPDHPKLTHYNSRRLAHFLKLCMVSSVSRSSTLKIDGQDFHTARYWLIEAERAMPDVFLSMGHNADARAMNDCWYFMFREHSKTKRPIFQQDVYRFLADRVPAYQIPKMVEVMVQSGKIRLEFVKGIVAYVPIKID